jgi:hypothetical protein
MALVSLENKMVERLRELEDPNLYETLSSRYTYFRSELFKEVIPYIRAAEPCLSDHSELHIIDVLNNADSLIGDKYKDSLSPLDLYILCLSILFHDAGNVYGREDHHARISEIYETLFQKHKDRSEQILVSAIAGAHTGDAQDGSKDTLKPLVQNNGTFKGKGIKVLELAAILRMADELAEGPQRTTKYAKDINLFKNNVSSKIFHDYASATDITIDRQRGVIMLKYHIDISKQGRKFIACGHGFNEFIKFILKRMAKLNVERKFTSYYSEILKDFRKIRVSMIFHSKAEYYTVSEPECELNDLVVPGEDDFSTLNSMGWDEKKLLSEIQQKMSL